MAGDTTAQPRAVCDNCGFSAPDGGEEWVAIDHPPLGRLTTCPECGSTAVYSRG